MIALAMPPVLGAFFNLNLFLAAINDSFNQIHEDYLGALRSHHDTFNIFDSVLVISSSAHF